MNSSRQVQHIIASHPTSDGDGVRIQRIAGFSDARYSPFLMIDELKSDDSKDYIGGFPPHPHRGIETLTYMRQGHFQHRDHMGNVGQLKSGGAQWMAAGRGVIHSEMPMMEEGGLHGFQIWINQPAKNKMQPAQYHDFQADVITQWNKENQGLLRVIAGDLSVTSSTGQKPDMLGGPLQTTGVPLSVSDWVAHAHDTISVSTIEEYNAFVYVYKGEVRVGNVDLKQGQLALLDHAMLINLLAHEDAGVLIFVGQPIDEPIVHYGPFVMNTQQEIEQTILDYQSGLFDTY